MSLYSTSMLRASLLQDFILSLSFCKSAKQLANICLLKHLLQ